ncbi:oligosaccharide flippase family protein [uncultured Vagococcus sp.]|uniref:lipopolysaccharide biosynthesis protein n=1 Tax=uncultured Vagococcus sp. TaxID=189676 RepID=UPI0028D6CB89|nr:oligosaccharide flippase family protein [uncultured Vagococcus sp.]
MKDMLKKFNGSALIKSGIWYTAANFLLKGVNFFTIPIFTKMMSVDQYGTVDNFTSWVSIFTVIVGLNLSAAVNNATFEYKDDIKRFLSSVVFLGTLFFFMLLGISNLAYSYLGLFSNLNNWMLNFVIIQSYSQFIISFLSAYYIINSYYKRNIFLLFLSTMLNIGISLLFMVTVYENKPADGRIIGSTLGLLALALVILIKLLVEGKQLYNKEYWKFSLKIALPVIPHSLGNMLLSRFDRIIIKEFYGAYYVGLYGYIYNISSIINVLWSSANNAWVPWFFNKMSEKKYTEIFKVSKLFTYFFTLMTIGVMTVTTDLARIMAPASYLEAIPLLIPISMSYYFMFLYGFPVNAEFYLKKTSIIGLGTVLSAGINIALNYLLIPRYGYMAAGATNLVTYILLYVFHQIIVLKIFKEKIFPLKTFIQYSSILGVFGICLFLTLDNWLLKYAIMSIFCLGLLFKLYKEGKEYLA